MQTAVYQGTWTCYRGTYTLSDAGCFQNWLRSRNALLTVKSQPWVGLARV